MTTVALRSAPSTLGSDAWMRAASITTCVAVLLARPTIGAALGWSTPVVVGVFAIVLALGLATPVRFGGRTSRGSTSWQLWVFAAGAFVFSVGRLISTGSSPMPTSGLLIALNTLAAIAEEAIFRRVAFDAFLPAGPVAAIGCSAFLFALAHVTVYGWWALPIDLAAGVIFGWQRWASGGWAVPAATHALADLLVVI